MSPTMSLGAEIPTVKAVLGKNVMIQGQIRSREDLTIEGEVDGTIEMLEHRLTIATDGKVRANVKAREIEVLGSVEGKIDAVEKVYIRKSAQLIGDIHSAGIIIEDGGYIKGSIELSRLPADSQNVRTSPSSLEALASATHDWSRTPGSDLVA
jgi:cytoskeletal protein CcmA (bactofilin family)